MLNESIPPCMVDLTRLIIGFNKSLFDIICLLANALAFVEQVKVAKFGLSN